MTVAQVEQDLEEDKIREEELVQTPIKAKSLKRKLVPTFSSVMML